MWVIFIAIFLALIAVGLAVVYASYKLYLKIQREQRDFDTEDAAYEEIKKKIRKEMMSKGEDSL